MNFHGTTVRGLKNILATKRIRGSPMLARLGHLVELRIGSKHVYHASAVAAWNTIRRKGEERGAVLELDIRKEDRDEHGAIPQLPVDRIERIHLIGSFTEDEVAAVRRAAEGTRARVLLHETRDHFLKHISRKND
jgi:hypothetical protein